MGKILRITGRAWTSNWNNNSELVNYWQIITRACYIFIPICLWFWIWSYGYDSAACYMQNDLFFKKELGSKGAKYDMSIDDLCQHNYPSYYLTNGIFSLFMIMVMMILILIVTLTIIWLCLSYRGCKILLTKPFTEIGYGENGMDYVIAFILSSMVLGFISLIFMSSKYDSIACHFDNDFLGKMGSYDFIEKDNVITMENLCQQDYASYYDINLIFAGILVGRLIILMIVSALLYQLGRMIRAFYRHLRQTCQTVHDDLDKIV